MIMMDCVCGMVDRRKALKLHLWYGSQILKPKGFLMFSGGIEKQHRDVWAKLSS